MAKKSKKRTPTSKLHGAALAKRLQSEKRLGRVASRGKGRSASSISREYNELVKHMQEDKILPEEGLGYVTVSPVIDGSAGESFFRPVRRSYKATFKEASIKKEIDRSAKAAHDAAKKVIVARKARETLRRKLTSYYGPNTAEDMLRREDEKIRERMSKATTTKASSEGGR